MTHHEETKYGFIYGCVAVERCCSDEKKGWCVLSLKTPKQDLRVYVTKTGKIRIHDKNRKEWKPTES